jgi:hypothetical protein
MRLVLLALLAAWLADVGHSQSTLLALASL